MPATYVEKSVQINASMEHIESVLSDFNQWLSWSPWLLMEPEATVTVADDNHYYEWSGNRVGSGNMVFNGVEDVGDSTRLLRYSLNFLTPWKSTAEVEFVLRPTEVEERVDVTWTMHSSLPFFLFWMKKSIQNFIGMDYERGLAMLKEQIETSSVSSALDFVGETVFNKTKYIGITTVSELSDMEVNMNRDFTALGKLMDDREEVQNGAPFSIYHDMDMSKHSCKYTAAIPVSAVPSDLPDDMVVGDFPETKMYCLRHEGKYEHLGNAWSTLHSMQRNKEFVTNNKANSVEVYINDPDEVVPQDLITDVMMPIK